MVPVLWNMPRLVPGALDVYEVPQPFERLRRGSWKNPVTEIEDVPRPVVDPGEHIPRTALNRFPWSQQQRRVKITLDTSLSSNSRPHIVER